MLACVLLGLGAALALLTGCPGTRSGAQGPSTQSQGVRVAAMADTYGVGFAPHDCTGPISFAVTTQVACAQPNAVVAETVRAFTSDWYRLIADGGPTVADGHLTPTDTPGLGIRLREDFLARPDTITRTTRLAR